MGKRRQHHYPNSRWVLLKAIHQERIQCATTSQPLHYFQLRHVSWCSATAKRCFHCFGCWHASSVCAATNTSTTDWTCQPTSNAVAGPASDSSGFRPFNVISGTSTLLNSSSYGHSIRSYAGNEPSSTNFNSGTTCAGMAIIPAVLTRWFRRWSSMLRRCKSSGSERTHRGDCSRSSKSSRIYESNTQLRSHRNAGVFQDF